MSRPSVSRDYEWGGPLDFLRCVWNLNHELERASLRMLRELGITAQQRLIVRAIGKFPGLPPGQLASLLHLDPSTISAALVRLEAKGILERRRDARDRRRIALGLTARGRELDRPTARTIESTVKRLLDTVDARDVDSTIRMLEAFTILLESEFVDSESHSEGA